MRLRKGRTGGNRGRRAVAAGLFVALAAFVGACSGTPTDAGDTDFAIEANDADFSLVLGDLTEGLGLSDDQVSAVREVMEKYRGQGREPGTLWYAAADLQGVLSSDQIAAIDARLAERAQRAGDGSSRGRRGAGRGEGLGDGNGSWSQGGRHGSLDVLDLSDEQLEQLKEIRETYAPELAAIRDGIRDGSLSREAAGERLGEIRESMHEAMQAILTEEQVVQLEEHRSEAEARRDEARSQREDRRQSERAAMVSALGLTEEQVAALDALDERPARDGRPSPEEMQELRDARHQALLEVLDDDQEEIWILHNSLVRSFARHRVRGRGGEGFSGEDGARRRGGFSKSRGARVRMPASGA